MTDPNSPSPSPCQGTRFLCISKSKEEDPSWSLPCDPSCYNDFRGGTLQVRLFLVWNLLLLSFSCPSARAAMSSLSRSTLRPRLSKINIIRSRSDSDERSLWSSCIIPNCQDPNCFMVPDLVCTVIDSEVAGLSSSASSVSSNSDEPLPAKSAAPMHFPAVMFQRSPRPSRQRNPAPKDLTLYQRARPQQTRMEQLLELSNYASGLCVIDCTLLPLLTIGLSLLGGGTGAVAATGTSTTSAWLLLHLHELGHMVALWFVLPVGLLASCLNFSVHGKKSIVALALLGLLGVTLANAGCSLGHVLESYLPESVGQTVHHTLHSLHHGVTHRVVNLVGCALLLLSNYLSRRESACTKADCWC